MNISKDVQSKKLVVGQFQLLIDKKLYKEDDSRYLGDAFQIMNDNLKDKKIVDEIAYQYYLHLTQWNALKNNFDASLESGSKAYALNQKDIRLQDLIVKLLYHKIETTMDGDQMTAVKKLVKSVELYPFLKSDSKFKSVILLLYSGMAAMSFGDENPTEGYEYLARVEGLALAGMENATERDKALYSSPWCQAALYHFGRKEYSKSRDIINKGLKIFPGDDRLKMTMEDIKREEAYRRK